MIWVGVAGLDDRLAQGPAVHFDRIDDGDVPPVEVELLEGVFGLDPASDAVLVDLVDPRVVVLPDECDGRDGVGLDRRDFDDILPLVAVGLERLGGGNPLLLAVVGLIIDLLVSGGSDQLAFLVLRGIALGFHLDLIPFVAHGCKDLGTWDPFQLAVRSNSVDLRISLEADQTLCRR